MVVDVVFLAFYCVIGEDCQQMELDTVIKGFDSFLTGLLVVPISIKIGPRSDTNLVMDYTGPLDFGCFVQQIFVECKDRGTSLFLLLSGFFQSLRRSL